MRTRPGRALAQLQAAQIRTDRVARSVDYSVKAWAANRGDQSVTLVWGVDAPLQPFRTALTANRVVTLSATSAGNGAWFRIVREGLGAFTLDVGGLRTIAGLTAGWVEVGHDGTAWRLAGYGTL